MSLVPAWLFALHIQTQRVAGIQELRIGRIVAQANSIHIHALNEQHILYVLLLRQRSTSLRTERMTIHTLENDFLTIDKHAILFVASIRVAIFDSTEAKLLAFFVEGLSVSVLQRKHCCI